MDSVEPQEEELDFHQAASLNEQRQIFRRKPKKAIDVINNIIVKRGIAVEKTNHQLQNKWDAIVGIEFANQTKVASIRRGVLEVIVTNSSLMQMLGFQKHEFKDKLNQEMRNTEIKDIRFRIGRID